MGVWRVLRQPAFIVGSAILLFVIIFSISIPLSVSIDGGVQIGSFDPNLHPSTDHPLGTNAYGQDLFIRLGLGLRMTLIAAFAGAFFATLLGTFIGVWSALRGGFFDRLFSGFISVMLLLPVLLATIMIVSAVESRTVFTVVRTVIFFSWPLVAFPVRRDVKSLKKSNHIVVARMGGVPPLYILWSHIMPYLGSTIVLTFIQQFSLFLLVETALSLLGFSPSGVVTLGIILYESRVHESFINGSWWSFIPAVLTIASLPVSLSLINRATEVIFPNIPGGRG